MYFTRDQKSGYSRNGAYRGAVDWDGKLFKGFIQKTTLSQTGRSSGTSLVPPFALPAQDLLLWALHKGLNL